jgi:hypothetical protein
MSEMCAIFRWTSASIHHNHPAINNFATLCNILKINFSSFYSEETQARDHFSENFLYRLDVKVCKIFVS